MRTPLTRKAWASIGVAGRSDSGAQEEIIEALGCRLESCRRFLLLVANRELDSDLKRKGGASDLVQETFIEAQRRFVRFEGESDSELRAWLRQILLYKIADFNRRYRATAKRRQSLEVDLDMAQGRDDCPVETCTPSWHASKAEERDLLERAVERLPEAYRRVILLVNRDHRSFAEAGRELERSTEAARKLWSRAIVRLREEFGATHEST